MLMCEGIQGMMITQEQKLDPVKTFWFQHDSSLFTLETERLAKCCYLPKDFKFKTLSFKYYESVIVTKLTPETRNRGQ